MKHNPNTSLGEAQSDGPSPWLLSPQATLLPGLGPRPSSSWSWSLPWGCNTEKVPTGGPFGYTLLQMGAAPDFRTCREGGRTYGAAQASRPRCWKAPPWGGGGRWVKAAETELTRTPPPPQPQVPQALSEQTALSPLDVCVRGNSGEGSITQNL